MEQELQSYGIGEIQKGEIRSWLKNIPLDQAKQDLEEIEEIPTENNIAI